MLYCFYIKKTVIARHGVIVIQYIVSILVNYGKARVVKLFIFQYCVSYNLLFIQFCKVLRMSRKCFSSPSLYFFICAVTENEVSFYRFIIWLLQVIVPMSML